MNKKFSRFCLSLTALLTASTVGLQANCASSCEESCDNACSVSTCSGRGFISADFLYLRAEQNGLDYCFSRGFSEETVGEDVITNFHSEIKDPNFKWSPGYRVGAGWEFTDKCWAIAATWMHLNSKANTSFEGQHLHWKLDFDVIDLVAGARFYDQCPFSIDLFGGLRGARIDQKVHSNRYNDFLDLAKRDHNKQKFTGVGPVAGLILNWDVGCGFGFYVDGAIAGLYGNYRNHFDNTVFITRDIRHQHIRQRSNACIGVFDAGVGIRWDSEICEDRRVFR